jgi:hypothetical protein
LGRPLGLGCYLSTATDARGSARSVRSGLASTRGGVRAQFAWAVRADVFVEAALIRRIDALSTARPALDLRSNPVTRNLLEPSPIENVAYKHREDLIDALLAAWTAALWHGHGLARCQVLGVDDPLVDKCGAHATIIDPARQEQRSAEATR